MRHPQRFLGAALLSAPLVLPLWPPGALRGKPVFYGHGDETDKVVVPALFEAAEAYLGGPSACTLTARHYQIGHEIGATMIKDLSNWFLSQQRGPLD